MEPLQTPRIFIHVTRKNACSATLFFFSCHFLGDFWIPTLEDESAVSPILFPSLTSTFSSPHPVSAISVKFACMRCFVARTKIIFTFWFSQSSFVIAWFTFSYHGIKFFNLINFLSYLDALDIPLISYYWRNLRAFGSPPTWTNCPFLLLQCCCPGISLVSLITFSMSLWVYVFQNKFLCYWFSG